MKSLVIASLIAGQMLAPVQAAAAGPDRFGPSTTEVGAFAGARLRLPLGGGARKAPPRFSLALTPMLRAASADGQVQMRFGEGVGVGFSGGRSPQLTLGGLPLASRFSAAEEGERKKDSTGKKVLKGAAVVAIVAVGVVGGLFLAYEIACGDNRCSE